MDGKTKVNIFSTRDALSSALSAHVVHLAEMATAEQGRFSVAFSGGSILDIISPSLGSNSLRDTVNWSGWHVFLADERWVPWSSPESNYGHAQRQFVFR